MTRPADYPDWATGASANIVEPVAGKKAAGFNPSERPPAEYLNWWMKLVNDWIEHLDSDELVLGSGVIVEAEYAGNPTPKLHHQGTYWGSDDTGGGNGTLRVPITARVGFVVNKVTIYVLAPNAAGEVMSCDIYKEVMATKAVTQISTTKDSGSGGAATTVEWTSADTDMPFTIEAGTSYFVSILVPDTTTKSESKVYGVQING